MESKVAGEGTNQARSVSQFKRCIDLESLYSGHADDIRDARLVAYFAEGFLQRLLIGGDESEPDIVFMASMVIVRDAGIGIHNRDELLQSFFGNLRGAKSARIAHLLGIKDSSDPADNSLFLQFLNAQKSLILTNACLSSYFLEGFFNHRKILLDDIQNLLVDAIHHLFGS